MKESYRAAPNKGDAAARPNRHPNCFRNFCRRFARPLMTGDGV